LLRCLAGLIHRRGSVYLDEQPVNAESERGHGIPALRPVSVEDVFDNVPRLKLRGEPRSRWRS